MPYPGWGGGYSGFQVTGMIEGFFGFEILNTGIFWVGKFDNYFLGWLDLGSDFWGYSKQSEESWVVPVLTLVRLFVMFLLGVVLFRVVIQNFIVETEDVLGYL